jgi:hypothetical protein
MVFSSIVVLFLAGREHGHFKSGVAEVSQAPGRMAMPTIRAL